MPVYLRKRQGAGVAGVWWGRGIGWDVSLELIWARLHWACK